MLVQCFHAAAVGYWLQLPCVATSTFLPWQRIHASLMLHAQVKPVHILFFRRFLSYLILSSGPPPASGLPRWMVSSPGEEMQRTVKFVVAQVRVVPNHEDLTFFSWLNQLQTWVNQLQMI